MGYDFSVDDLGVKPVYLFHNGKRLSVVPVSEAMNKRNALMEPMNRALSPKRLLVVDDDPAMCEVILEVAEDLGFRVATVSETSAFESAYRDHEPQLLVLDLNMPGTDGIQLLRFLADRHSHAAVLLISGLDRRTLASAERLGKTRGLKMLGTLQKPIQIPVLEEALSTVVAGA